MAGTPLTGSLWILLLYDVCEEIDLDTLRALLRVQPRREPSFRHPSPEYVRFERPPVVQPLEPIQLESGTFLQGELNYFEYGVVSIKLELPFQADWPQLTELSSRWMTATELEAQAVHQGAREGVPGAEVGVRCRRRCSPRVAGRCRSGRGRETCSRPGSPRRPASLLGRPAEAAPRQARCRPLPDGFGCRWARPSRRPSSTTAGNNPDRPGRPPAGWAPREGQPVSSLRRGRVLACRPAGSL